MDPWTPQVESARFHPNFRAFGLEPHFAPERKILDTWAGSFLDRDGKLVIEFQTTFSSAFWEIYLHACFKQLGLAADFSVPAPDFVSPGAFVAEAVTAQEPAGYAPEWEARVDDPPDSKERFVALASVRIANAIDSKLRKYRESYAALPHVKDRPFVVCVGAYEQPRFFMQGDMALRRVLFAHDEPIWFDDSQTGKRIVVGEAAAPFVTKPSGAKIDLGIFRDDRAKEISAVLFSSMAVVGKVRAQVKGKRLLLFKARRFNPEGLEADQIVAQEPEYTETVLDGLHLCLNPFAEHHLDTAIFEKREIALHDYFPEVDLYLPQAPSGFLFDRECIEVTTVPPTNPRPRVAEFPKYPIPDLEVFPEGELRAVAGVVGPYSDHHLAHYKGWTVLVAKDNIDDDWGSHARKGSFRTIQEFVQAGDKPYLPASDWFSSRDQAFDSMKVRIDGGEEPI